MVLKIMIDYSLKSESGITLDRKELIYSKVTDSPDYSSNVRSYISNIIEHNPSIVQILRINSDILKEELIVRYLITSSNEFIKQTFDQEKQLFNEPIIVPLYQVLEDIRGLQGSREI